MTKRTFTKEEVEKLSQSDFTKKVSEKSITYTDEFKIHFVAERQKGKRSKDIFHEAGLDPDILGCERITTFSKKWMKRYREQGEMGLRDTRQGNSGRPRLTELSTEEKLKRAQKENQLLRSELELLKKLDFTERRGSRLTKTEKFELIRQVTSRLWSISVERACSLLEVSTSGYYNHFSWESQRVRIWKEKQDEFWKDQIIEAMAYKNVPKGSRAIVMYFYHTVGIKVNRKKIQRIMRKYGLVCPIRRKNPYKQMAKATKEHRTKKNILQRSFNQGKPYKVLLTDITYLHGKNGFIGYLSTIIDGATKETLAYYVSDNLKQEIVTETIKRLMDNHGHQLTEDVIIHSDQGVHYTSPVFQNLVKEAGLVQSMSRRGNCWDNAPQESYFGHLKDEIHYEDCTSLTELRTVIDDFMSYYNNERGQWNLKKLTPVLYRSQLLQQAA